MTVLGRLLSLLDPGRQWQTALDAGCGVGFFSRYLADRGYRVVGFDGRSANIIHARRRHPDIVFHCFDVEDHRVCQLETFDLGLCFGLLYHLENPMAAVRNLAAMSRHALMIETMICPSSAQDEATALLLDEFQGPDQGLRHLALIPTKTCLVKMLYRAGFTQVYQVRHLPDHPDFHESASEHQKRTMLVALRQAVEDPNLLLCLDHRPRWDACWKKS